jgi:hypothetical protein
MVRLWVIEFILGFREVDMKVKELISTVIRNETRKGADMNITHGTAFFYGMIALAKKDPLGFLALCINEIKKKKK